MLTTDPRDQSPDRDGRSPLTHMDRTERHSKPGGRDQGDYDMRTIIVPLDGSPIAERAIEPGLAFAARSGANLVLLTVAEDPAHGWSRPYLEERVGSLMVAEGSDGRMPTIETE